ncbi:hypothetical protein ABMA27_005050 [Loxostege sticticalis]|uniref:Gag protein n=1 Tax=Loxostege sticticalis TaxID=481309 RepID=A0ABR3HLM6_LOXSC
MPKRSSSEKIEIYQAKIRKLQQKQIEKDRRRRKIVIFSDSSQSENSDTEITTNNDTTCLNESVLDASAPQPHIEAETPLDAELPPDPEKPSDATHLPTADASAPEEIVPELDAEFLSALGDAPDELPKYGEKIHHDLAQRWLPILRRGIPKEQKESLIKDYAIPENCKLLRAPTLNPEISAAITDASRTRDKKLESGQQQLGLGITAINKAMSLIMTGDDKQTKVKAIKMLSDGCRILSDLHHTESQARIKLITPNLDKTFLNIIQDVERDEFLFGSKLSEKIKASKTIEKQGLQIKKGTATQKAPTPSTSQAPARSRYQGNWTAPSRYSQPSNRGGRGGAQKHQSSSSYKGTPHQQNKPSTQAKPRAPQRQ